MRTSFQVKILRAEEHLRMNTVGQQKKVRVKNDSRKRNRTHPNLWSVFQQTPNYIEQVIY